MISDYQRYIAASRYARYNETKNRRETWEETVERLCSYWRNKYPDIFPYEELKLAITNMEVMPSMRSLLTAGKALERDNVAGYNCSYLPINDPRCFDELLYILMCGTGVGFSVERQEISQLPVVAERIVESDSVLKVRDSKIGWATAFKELIAMLYAGNSPSWDLSSLRPAGAPLKTFGGRSSGPEPLNELFNFTVALFKRAVGRKLTSLECHDLCCKIAEVVVVGGVRRSALISLSNLSDDRIRQAKNGAWWEDNVQRALANNSVAYTEKPDIGIFMDEWKTLYESKSGERGIFNRVAAKNQARKTGRREYENISFGTNPCGEIILRPFEFCNLTEAVLRNTDTIEDLKEKVRLATILGTFQSTLTNFRYLRSIWKKNVEEERLLGVSLTGIMDSILVNNPELAIILQETAILTNKLWAEKLGINPAASITTIKPSGTVSQLVDSSSGIHPRFSPYYIRTVRADKTDPLAQFLTNQGIPYEDDVTKPHSTWVFSFPMKSPEGAICVKDITALEQLDFYAKMKTYWCEHNPSITIYVQEHEWLEVGAWVYKHFDLIGGVSFLPASDHVYKQAPYQEISREQYEELSSKFPRINWEQFKEEGNNVTATKELACVSGVCEI